MNRRSYVAPYGLGVGGVPKGVIATSPNGFPNSIAGGHKRTITKQALRVLQGASDGLAHSFTFRVYSPSARFRLSILVMVQTDDGTNPSPTNITWNLLAVGVDGQTGRDWDLQIIYPTSGTQVIPDGAEFDSAVERIRGTVNFPANGQINFTETAGAGANIVIQASWEPNVDIEQRELEQLFAACSLQIDGNPKTATEP